MMGPAEKFEEIAHAAERLLSEELVSLDYLSVDVAAAYGGVELQMKASVLDNLASYREMRQTLGILDDLIVLAANVAAACITDEGNNYEPRRVIKPLTQYTLSSIQQRFRSDF
jgi:hypothetical protein